MSTLQQPDPFELAQRIASGCLDSTSERWLREGFAAWVRLDGAVPLERCLHLASTPHKARLVKRNFWLLEAARALGGANPWTVSVALAEELDIFVSRGPWRAWQDLNEPPEGASQLRKALFHVAKANGARSLTARHVHRLVRQIFELKCRTDLAMIEVTEKRSDHEILD